MKVLLKYTFIFDPSEGWSSQGEFDGTLASYFKKIGFQAETVRTPDDSNIEKIVIISKVQDLIPAKDAAKPTNKGESVGQQFRNLAKVVEPSKTPVKVKEGK